jgi:signal transduction histidine kinase
MRFCRTAAAALTAVSVGAVVVMAASGDVEGSPWWALPALVAVVGVPIGLGWLLLARRPDLVVGVVLVGLGTAPLVVFALDSWGSTTWSGAHLAAVLSTGGWIGFYLPPAILAALFPYGTLPSRRWRWLIAGWPPVIVGFLFGVWLDPGTYVAGGGTVAGHPPDGIPRALGTVLGLGSLAGLLALLIGSATVLIRRYRRADPLLRRQIRWFALGAFFLPPVLLLAWASILLTGDPGAGVVVGLLVVFFAMPVGTLVGVLRHDLYDIDRLLSRTVSYTVLTAALSGLFALVALGTGLVLGRHSAAAAALATLACATAFGPVRRRVQHAVDRRFDRDRDQAVRRIREFVEDVRDGAAAPEQIEDVLRLALGDDALRIAYALPGPSWWDTMGEPVGRPEQPCREIVTGGRLLAVLSCAEATAARSGLVGDVLREAHLPLELARAGLEVRAALAETAASRERLVRAGYDERRRLERDLHDGAQQRLVAVGMSLRLAQRHQPPGLTHDVLDEAVNELQEAVAELRRISRGVRPQGLDEGLPAALRTLVRACPVPVELTVTSDRLHDAVATTAYYVAAEAVANALKHAQPQRVRVLVSRAGEELLVSVVDDGLGGARIVAGSGLAGLTDRVAAVGGTLRLDSVLGSGTCVEVRLPCAS